MTHIVRNARQTDAVILSELLGVEKVEIMQWLRYITVATRSDQITGILIIRPEVMKKSNSVTGGAKKIYTLDTLHAMEDTEFDTLALSMLKYGLIALRNPVIISADVRCPTNAKLEKVLTNAGFSKKAITAKDNDEFFCRRYCMNKNCDTTAHCGGFVYIK